ncbi:MAG: hypothetical protein EF813_06605 [Methanosarcinales archaeon]|nr:MAG: hypothetical protein EF813_06605 [Methanosarcinales archaeon]
MDYKTLAMVIELLAVVIMVIAFYYGCSLTKHIPKELKSLNLLVFAIFFMILRRIASLCSFEMGGLMIVVSVCSLIIATLVLLGFRRIYSNVRGKR